MKTVYVVMRTSNYGDLPHSVYLTRKEALAALIRIEKRGRAFYFIEKAKMGIPHA